MTGRALLPVAVCFALTGCSVVAHVTGGFEVPLIELQASKVAAISKSNAHLVFELSLHNPNVYTVTAHALRYRLSVNRTVLADSSINVAVIVAPGAPATVDLPIDVQLDRLSDAAGDAMVRGEIPYELDVRLSVDSWLREHEVHLNTSSVLRLNLPLGLAHAGAVAFQEVRWQS